MGTESIDYADNGTLEQLSETCHGDEIGFRGPLVRLERVQNAEGKKGIRATYNSLPFDQPFVRKALFFFDVTDASASEIHDITVSQLAEGHALAFPDADKAEVYLGGNEAVVAIYREG